MKELKEMIGYIKENPIETISSVLFLTTLFTVFYVSLWIFCPC